MLRGAAAVVSVCEQRGEPTGQLGAVAGLNRLAAATVEPTGMMAQSSAVSRTVRNRIDGRQQPRQAQAHGHIGAAILAQLLNGEVDQVGAIDTRQPNGRVR